MDTKHELNDFTLFVKHTLCKLSPDMTSVQPKRPDDTVTMTTTATPDEEGEDDDCTNF